MNHPVEHHESTYLHYANMVGVGALVLSTTIVVLAVVCLLTWRRAPGRWCKRHPYLFLTPVFMSLMFLADPALISLGSFAVGQKIADNNVLHLAYHLLVAVLVLVALNETFKRFVKGGRNA